MRFPRSSSIALATAAVALSGCGGTSKITFATERQAAEAAVQRYIDKDDCSVASDRFVRNGYPQASDPRAACEADVTAGWQAGQYRLVKTTVTGATATVQAEHLDVRRTYYLVRTSEGWRLDGLRQASAARIAGFGQSLRSDESWTLDGRQVDTRLRLVVGRLAARRLPSGRCAVGARVRAHSTSNASVSLRARDFAVVTAGGRAIAGRGLTTGPLRLRPRATRVTHVAFRVSCSTRLSGIAYSYLGKGQLLLWTARA